MRRVALPTLLVGGVVVVVLLVYALTFQVRFSDVAVKVRFGKVAAVIREPDIYFRLPWPIESVYTYDRRLRTLDTPEGEVKTRDGKNVVVGCYALWQVDADNPVVFKNRVGNERMAEEQLRARVNQRRAAVIGNEDLSSFVNPNEQAVKISYDRMEDSMLHGKLVGGEGDDRSLQEGVLADFGIKVTKIAIRRVSLPEETTQSVFQQMMTERQTEAARYREEGKAIAETITGQAKSASEQILAFAGSVAQRERSKGQRAARRIYEQIAAGDQEFFEWLRWLDALQAALKQKSTIFLDSRSALFEHFVQPMPPTTQPTTPAAAPAGGK